MVDENKTARQLIKDFKTRKLTLSNFLNPTNIISEIKDISKIIKKKTGTTKGPAGRGFKRGGRVR